MSVQARYLCECGCGEEAPIAKRNQTRFGHVKGEPVRFINGHQNRGRLLKLTPEQVIEVLDGYRDGQSLKHIGDRLGISTSTVRYHAEVKAGLSRDQPARSVPTFDGMDKYARRQLKLKYGITFEDYKLMYETQGGSCALCLTDACVTGRRLAVDHDHQTGRIRGLVCAPCNIFLSVVESRPEVFDDGGKSYMERVMNHLNPVASLKEVA